MFPLLRTDADQSAWIDKVAADIEALAAGHRAELDDANAQTTSRARSYQELGRLGYVGPLVPTQWGGLGGGVA